MDTLREWCPTCGKPMLVVSVHRGLPPTLKCLDCDRIDPLQLPQIEAWTKSDALKPPDNWKPAQR